FRLRGELWDADGRDAASRADLDRRRPGRAPGRIRVYRVLARFDGDGDSDGRDTQLHFVECERHAGSWRALEHEAQLRHELVDPRELGLATREARVVLDASHVDGLLPS